MLMKSMIKPECPALHHQGMIIQSAHGLCYRGGYIQRLAYGRRFLRQLVNWSDFSASQAHLSVRCESVRDNVPTKAVL